MRFLMIGSTLVFLLLWVPPVLAADSTGTAPPDTVAGDLSQRIQELKRLVKHPSAPDSLRYELALAYHAAGTIEDRSRSLEMFNVVRRSYGNTARFRWDLAMLFEDCQQPSRARQCLEALLELEPRNVPAHVEIARLWLRELLYHYDLNLTDKMLEVLQRALAIEPDNRDALFLASFAHELVGGLPQKASPAHTAEGIACVEKILKLDPQDLPARLLLAVHLTDIGRLEDAERQFNTALASSPEDLQQAFASSEWTAPRAAVAKFASLTGEERANYDQGYWAYYDPTPLTLINENRLEIWKRLAIAEFLFGKPEKGVRGWRTDPGEALVRFGAPVSHLFDPGAVVGGPEPNITMPPAGLGWDYAATKANLHFTAPALAWGYTFRGLDFSLLFSDLNLNGNFYVDDWSAKTMDVLRRATPVIFHEVPPGTIRYLYLASAGVAGPAGGVQQAVELGVPLWRHPQERDWLDRVRVDIVVRDSTRTPVKRSLRKASPADVYPMLPDLDVLLVSAEYDLRPGKYTVTAFVEDEESKEHGEYTVPIQARDFAGESPGLVLSDLQVTLGASRDSPGPKVTKLGRTFVPNPMCLVGDDRNLEVFYELYGLTLRGGQAQCQVRYTVLPRGYVLGFERHVREGRVSAESMVGFAADGVKAGKSQLDLSNYADMLFPEEALNVEKGRVAKGVVLRLASLEPGEYALVVTATDMLSQATATARTFFRILTDVQLRELMAYTQQ